MWARLGSDNRQRGLRLAIIAAVLLGVFLRVYLYALRPSTMWEDEAYWAWKTLTLPVLTQPFRPPAFLLLTKGLITWLGPSDFTYRALPFVWSLAGLLVTPYVASQSFRSTLVRLAVVVVMATHPGALTLTVEFKHYGLEIGVLAVIFACYLRYRERPGKQSLALLLGLSWAAFFFSILIMFCYPALFGVLAWDALKSKRLRALAVVGGAALLCVATIMTIYFTTWRHFNQARAEKKWGSKYDVFYVPGPEESRAAWTAKKYAAVAALPGYGRERWSPGPVSETTLVRLIDADRIFWLALHGLGIYWLIRERRLRELIWLWSPLWIMTLFNLLGRWPAGAFRTNAGILPFMLYLSAFGLEAAVALGPRFAKVALPLGCLLVIAPPLVFRPDWLRKGCFARAGQFDEVFDALAASPTKKKRTTVLMDNSSCRPWKYYANYDSRFEKTNSPQIRKRFVSQCGGRIAQRVPTFAKRGDDFWVLATDRRNDAAVDKATRRSCRKVEYQDLGNGLHGLWHCYPKGKKRAENDAPDASP